MTYVPTVKARQAEIKALLSSPSSLDVTPLFELQLASPPAKDPKTGALKRTKSTTTDASYFLDDIARLWGEELYVDISRVCGPSQRTAWWSLLATLNNLHSQPAKLIPVVTTDDDPASLTAAGRVAAITGRAALRLNMVGPPLTPTVVGGLPGHVTTHLGVPVSALDVVLDWKALKPTTPTLDKLEGEATATLAALAGRHGLLITTATPDDSSFQQAGDWTVKRREWQLWLRLAHAGLPVTYGDYVLYSPADPVPARPRYGHLRYSFEDTVHVHRRMVPPTGGSLGGAFEDCCKHLVSQPHWLGGAFSGADRRLEDISLVTDKESDAGKWRGLAAEHHFALVAGQLASPPSPPPPGTV